MAHTVNWNSTFKDIPAGSDARSNGDDVIRELKLAIQEREKLGGHIWVDAASSTTHDGKHAVNAGGAGVSPDIYKADKTTKLVAYTDTDITFNENLKFAATKGLDPAGADDAVNQRHLVPGAISVTTSVLVTGPLSVGTGEALLATTPTLTTGTPDKGVVLVQAETVLTRTNSSSTMTIRLYRDATLIYTKILALNTATIGYTESLFYIDTPPAAGTGYTYSLKALVGAGSINAGYIAINAINLRH